MASRKVEHICVGCGRTFMMYPPQKYCTQQCWLKKYNTTDREHTMNGAARGSKSNGTKTRGTGSKASYTKEGGRHQHRIVMERILGRPLKSGEVVHHRDGNGRNNDPSNLQLFTSQAEHAREHLRLRGGGWRRKS